MENLTNYHFFRPENHLEANAFWEIPSRLDRSSHVWAPWFDKHQAGERVSEWSVSHTVFRQTSGKRIRCAWGFRPQKGGGWEKEEGQHCFERWTFTFWLCLTDNQLGPLIMLFQDTTIYEMEHHDSSWREKVRSLHLWLGVILKPNDLRLFIKFLPMLIRWKILQLFNSCCAGSLVKILSSNSKRYLYSLLK